MNIKQGDVFASRFEGWDKLKLSVTTAEGKFLVVASIQSDSSWKVDSVEELTVGQQAPKVSTEV